MGIVLTLAHTKGGVAKTTSSVYLATAAHRAGLSVQLIDADPQRSASEWAEDAEAAGTPLPFLVRPASRPPALVPATSTPVDVTIIDTPPGTVPVIGAAIDAADLVIVPTGATPLSIRRVWPTLEVTAHKPTVVLLTDVDLRTVLSDEAPKVFEEEGVAVFGTRILRRQAIVNSYATVPDQLFGYKDVFTEIMEVLK